MQHRHSMWARGLFLAVTAYILWSPKKMAQNVHPAKLYPGWKERKKENVMLKQYNYNSNPSL